MTHLPDKGLVIAHELKGRLRLKSGKLSHSSLDPDYFEAIIESIPGVSRVRSNFKAASVIVYYDGRGETRRSIITGLTDLPLAVFNGKNNRKEPASLLSLAVKGAVALSCFFLPKIVCGPLALILVAPTLFRGFICLWNGSVKVDVLDAAAVAFCLYRRDFFTAATIVFLLELGEYVEELSENKSTQLLKSLLKPKTENIWIEIDGQEVEIPLADAQIGDRVVVGPGEMVPLDGIVADGDALVNQSSISGEALPVHMHPGCEVISGSVVEEGRIVFTATHVGSETSVARISNFLENSLRYASESQKKSDELADRLVPITFGLGLGLYALTRDPGKAAAVLTVDYSCVIKLSSPVAVRVSMYAAAKEGVLLKGAQAMDALASVDTLVFDKTGTLTRGKLRITDLLPVGDMEPDRLLVLAASAEEHYSHPVADAVVQAARDKNLNLVATSQVDFIVAHGVSAYIDGVNILVGSRHYIEDDEGIDCSALGERVAGLEKEGKSLLYVACDETIIGVIGMRDELRPESPHVLEMLKKTGIQRIVILTGDSKTTARALAEMLPAVDEVHADLKPEDKAGIVTSLKDQGRVVGFIGDGVNDAPALVSAHVGICLPSGADLAKESAQVILLREDLRTLLTARLMALRCQDTIRHCFVSAVGLNSSFLMLATLGLIQPVAAAILHNTSTIGILGYAALRERKALTFNTLEDDPTGEAPPLTAPHKLETGYPN